MNTGNNHPTSAVLENPDLLRVIGGYLRGFELPFILSFKGVKDALKPLNTQSGEQWILSKKKYFFSSIQMVEWTQSFGCIKNLEEWYDKLFRYAALNSSPDVLRWLHQKYPPDEYPADRVGSTICKEAAIHGNFQVLEYLRSLGDIVEWDEYVCCETSFNGQLHVLQWLREVLDPPCPWDEEAFFQACQNGNLHMLEWLKSKDAPISWDSSYCSVAADVHVLQWLRAQDPPCPWDQSTCDSAAYYGNLDILKWARSQEPPCPWVKQDCINNALEKNHHEVVEWILTQPE